MNKLYQIIIISFVFFLSPITGCKKNKKLFSPTLTSIQGTVNANNTDDFGLQETYAEHIKVDSAGNFSIQISLSEAGIYSFINDNTPIFFYIQPGDNITANLDFIQPDRTTFTGNHALENQFYKPSIKPNRIGNQIVLISFLNFLKMILSKKSKKKLNT